MPNLFASVRPTLFAAFSSLALACGGASQGANHAPSTTEASDPLAPLRPSGSETYLERLTDAPGESSAYADAAVFYSATRSGGMSLLWGLTYTALAGGQPTRDDVAGAMGRVLRERVSMQNLGGGNLELSTSLAPGAMPVIAQSNGAMHAPVAHVLEQQLAVCFATLQTPWTLDQAVRALRCFATSNPGPIANAAGDFRPWLDELTAAGHLDAFLNVAFGAAFPDAFGPYFEAHSGEVTSMQAWVHAHPFSPRQATLPDTLLRVR